MAYYKTEDLKKRAIEAIKKHNLFFIEDIIPFLPCCKSTFYQHKLEQSNELKELLENNRIAVKLKLRKKWEDSDNATLQMGLMKLICSDEEHRKLSLERRDITSGDEKIIISFKNGK